MKTDWYKMVCRNLVVPAWARWERSPYIEILKSLESSSFLALDSITDFQFDLIKKMLTHANQHCPFYKESFSKAGVSPSDFHKLSDLSKFPILNKQDIRRHGEAMIAGTIPLYRKYITSGSTGVPLSGWWDKFSTEFKRASKIRSETWCGYELGERVYCLYGNPEEELRGLRKIRSKLRRKLLDRTTILDLLRIDKNSLFAFFSKMEGAPPSLLWGHTHGLFLIAEFAKENGISPPCPKGIFSAGMPLYERERTVIENVFGCRVFNRYGCEELGIIASECEEHNGLHMNTDGLYFEFLDREGIAVPAGSPGQIVLTDLRNMAMPLIRYKLNDVCVAGDRPCSCGRGQPVISSIEGRTADFLISADGQLVSGISLTDHFTCHVSGVNQIQFIQESYKILKINLVTGPEFDQTSEEKISQLVRHFFGEQMDYELYNVEQIPQDASGKYRFSICKIDHGLF